MKKSSFIIGTDWSPVQVTGDDEGVFLKQEKVEIILEPQAALELSDALRIVALENGAKIK